MKVIKIAKKEWAGGLERLSDSFLLIGPVKQDKFHYFKELKKGEPPDLNLLNTRLSPKSVVYPQSEIMFEYTLDKNQEDHNILKAIDKDYSPRGVIGIRPCDAKAFLLVKANFDAPEYKDPYWIKSYKATILVDAGGHYLLKIITEKGENLLTAAGWSEKTDAVAAGDQIEAMKHAVEAKITARVATEKLQDKNTIDLFEAPFWEDVAFACINCGICTYLCPTCWCFDIQDETYGSSGIRMRNWDSCMYPLFTFHGSGHNPRNTKMQRVRQRFMHKLKYYVDKYGNGIQCVGCGRCVSHCPVNIDIRKVCDLMNSF